VVCHIIDQYHIDSVSLTCSDFLMTSLSSKLVEVIGILLDPELTLAVHVSQDEKVDKVVSNLLPAIVNRVYDNFELDSSARAESVEVFLREFDLVVGFNPLISSLSESHSDDTRQSTFAALTTPSQPERYLVMFGMQKPWSCIGELSERNKENVVMGMANLTIKDDGVSGKSGESKNSLKNRMVSNYELLSAALSSQRVLLGFFDSAFKSNKAKSFPT